MEDCNLKCVSCDSTTLVKDGKHNNMQRYCCKECGKRFDYGEYKETRFIHFNTYCNGTTKKKLTRENYCKPTSEISTDEYVKKQYEECMNNFDKNIRFFSNLNKKDFENSLNKFVKKNIRRVEQECCPVTVKVMGQRFLGIYTTIIFKNN